MMADANYRHHDRIFDEAERLSGQEKRRIERVEAKSVPIVPIEGDLKEEDEAMDEAEDEGDIVDDNTLMRLGIHEKWHETFGDLNQACSKPVRKWDSDIDNMNEVLRKEGKTAIMEVYSPPRVDALARMWGIMPGMSLDLTSVDPEDGMPWDFNIAEKRDKAEDLVARGSAMLIIGSPMCSALSQLQSLNWRRLGPEKVNKMI